MDAELFKTLFELRYAQRILERQARFWSRLDMLIRIFGLLSGTAAFAAITNSNQGFTMLFGIVFATFQAIEFAVGPGSKSAAADQQARQYAEAISMQTKLSVEELRQELLNIRAKDSVICFEFLRKLAYNDVAEETGRPDASYILSFLYRFMGFFA